LRIKRRVVALVSAAALVAAAAVDVATLAPAHADVISLPATGSITVHANGAGHGHGMSQYGAHGAAMKGLTATQILAFYYPNTTAIHIPSTSTIRVLLSGAGSHTTVMRAADLRVSGVSGVLDHAGWTYRLAAQSSGSGVDLQAIGSAPSAVWTTIHAGLANGAAFSSTSGGTVRVLRADGTSTAYRGVLHAFRTSSASVITVNQVTFDAYTEGVVPREMPASWEPAAVQTQAVAARSYGRNAVESTAGAGMYDICDTSQCQVYGGAVHYDSAGNVAWTDDPAALSGNNNEVLRYANKTIFAQFSASNGGWTVDGGQPYLVAKQDPYDTAATGDPYLGVSTTMPVSALTSAYGLTKVTELELTRDGHGQWGGRVVSGFVDGIDPAGHTQRIATTGFELQDALGLPTTWFTIDSTALAVHQSNYVAAAFTLLAARAPTSAESSPWTAQLAAGGSTLAVANGIAKTTAARQAFVNWLYKGFFTRSAGAGDQAFWAKYLSTHPAIDLESVLLASAEFYARSGGTNAGFVRALYTNKLMINAAVSSSGVATWSGRLTAGTTTRVAVAQAYVKDSRTVANRVSIAFSTVLGRTPSASNNSSLAPVYARLGYDTPLLEAQLIGGAEYRAKFGL
jgi:SpoIID/LytB domain protein